MIFKDISHLMYLIDLFKTLCPDFQSSNIDPSLTQPIFSLTELKEVDKQKLEDWIEHNKERLTKLINNGTNEITSQPVYLLIDYYFHRHISFFNNAWMMDYQRLKKIYQLNNTSFKRF